MRLLSTRRYLLFILIGLIAASAFAANSSSANEPNVDVFQERQALYEKYEALTLIPWYYLAAVDQYERNLAKVRKDIPQRDGQSAIHFKPEYWVGELNPNVDDTFPASIRFFNGNGLDGNADGVIDRQNDEDVLFTMAHYLQRYGTEWDDYKIALWEYYGNEKAVQQIVTIAKLYHHFQTLDLSKRVFPIPLFHNYSYRSTWGDRRGWGGRRIHEGTDIFASYGVPIRSTTYGVVEIKGWNKYGGWRIGIRDIDNTYHYYAHLSGYNDEIKEGDIVEPGTVIGYVGSSGYGNPGTSGKFPPHLHYGMYKFNGITEWSFDPYPYLRIWEKKERQQKRKNG